jgi:hypothetical protein
MDLPGASWINLALQIPLALVIVFLTIQFLRHLREESKAHRDWIARESEISREFIRTQNDSHNQALARLAEEQKAVRLETIRELASLTDKIDRFLEKIILWDRIIQEKPSLRRP